MGGSVLAEVPVTRRSAASLAAGLGGLLAARNGLSYKLHGH